MRTGWGVGIVAGALIAGCGHGGISSSASNTGDSVAANFDDAYQSVKSGAKNAVRWGEYEVERGSDGVVRAIRSAKESVSNDANDSLITARVKSKLAGDPLVHSGNISVDTDAGMVTLKGQVGTDREAARAVEDALTTDGVYGVNSHLSQPSATAGQPGAGQM